MPAGLKTVFAPTGKSLFKKTVRQSKMVSVDFSMFLDRPGVGERLLKKEKKILSITGYYTMKGVRDSMRPVTARDDNLKRRLRKKGKFAMARQIGAHEPPRRRDGTLRNKTYFGLDKNGYGVVIGPELLFKKSGLTTPEVLNYGGQTAVVLPKGVDDDSRQRVRATYLPRPFAGGSDAYFAGAKRFLELQEEIPL